MSVKTADNMDLEVVNKYRERFFIRSYECNHVNELFTSTIFDYMQQVATYHAYILGFGHEQLEKQGQYWVLSRARTQVIEAPKIGTELIVETWPKGQNKIFAFRDYCVKKKSGEKVALGTSAWVLMDINKKRPVRLPDNILKIHEEHAIAKEPDKIIQTDNMEEVYTHRVSYNDLDLNNHVNNVNYIRMSENCFNPKNFLEKKIKDLQINFLCECAYEDELVISKEEVQDNHYYVQGYNKTKNKLAFQTYMIWEDKRK